MKLVLHNYWRSSASHRVRIALGLKKLAYEYVVVNIIAPGGGQQHAPEYLARNPMAQVPTFEITEDDGSIVSLTQSLPIIEYIEERWPDPPLLPRDGALRAKARALAEIVNSGIQPLQNLSTTNAVNALGGKTADWVRPFLAKGLAAFAQAASTTAGKFCVGDAPSIADCFLIPQLASARRFEVDYSQHTQLKEIEERCLAIAAFADSMPDRQPDAVK